MKQVDELLPISMYDVLVSGTLVIGSSILVCIAVPWVTAVVAVLGILFLLLRRHYVTSSRELKRLEGVARSPVVSAFVNHVDARCVWFLVSTHHVC